MLAFAKEKLAAATDWIKRAYSEAGEPSSTRLHVGELILFVLAVGTSFAWLVHRGRISIEQFNAFLNAAGVFIATGAGALFGLSKFAGALGSPKDRQ